MDNSKLTIEKFELLKAMNLLLKYINDESAYFSWIAVIPDQASDKDLLEIAKDEELFADSCHAFRRICEDSLKHGFYIGGWPEKGRLYGAKKQVTEEEE